MTATQILILFAFILLVLLIKGLRIINKDEIIIVERFGKFHHILYPGIHFLIPLIEKDKFFPWKFSYNAENGVLLIRNTRINRIYLQEQVIHLLKDINADKKLVTTIILKVDNPLKMAYEPLLFKKLGENIDNSFKYSIGGLEREKVQENPKQYYETMLGKLNESIKDLGCKVINLKMEEMDSKKIVVDDRNI